MCKVLLENELFLQKFKNVAMIICVATVSKLFSNIIWHVFVFIETFLLIHFQGKRASIKKFHLALN